MKRRTTLALLVCLFAAPAFALYDPKPDAALSAVQGEWKGALTYRDYSKPDRLVTLPTRLFIALGAPNELVLHYVFDDGPSKTVFSYERMNFDLLKNEIAWASGSAEKAVSIGRITSNSVDSNGRQILFERKDGDKLDRYRLELSAGAFKLFKDEVSADGTTTFRNKFEFVRP
ncbi:hypothetical protein QN372_09460 [Undibacterium sp. RTI2.1]|uniref:hypothetical protein n=1 Tax=unclassified Undibacterium TaxID=2630295 RepID=UPI002AB380E3|nr:MULTISPECIES: hypothetical protein [unclassified Undibacterium]MDY7539102.1 hypothetical protein [Undibacterium sp. 5I1]MEB0030973.1 hypothetical protein [Undibacterium sp. RTI2.1]MEB0115820.1 hypothetical protein [Undibacterium sp. RTI2.2]MEB0229764.1 hypothetical protein [Undibacterium sp. 10I3]MEB0259267.1 hypothetical protein [Undibacterium sp. 5I1]